MNNAKFLGTEVKEIKTGRIEDACSRYRVGNHTMRQIAKDAEAVIRIGKCYLINFTKVDEYMDSISQKGE